MRKRYQVFISSTFVDLEEERQKVMKAILDAGCFPAGMEMFPAADINQFNYIKTIIDISDYYVLIIGGRYGSLDEDGISFTEKEFNYAIEKGIPVLVFLHSNPRTLPVFKVDTDPKMAIKLEEFKQKAEKGRLRKFWTNGDNLKYEVSTALREAFDLMPRPGWIKSDDIVKTASNVENSNVPNNYIEKSYVNEARQYFKLKGINLGSGYTESRGTNLLSGITELEEGRVLFFTPIDYDVVDNPVAYYYNVKNRVGYRYLDNNWTKL